MVRPESRIKVSAADKLGTEQKAIKHQQWFITSAQGSVR
jgi:hypothetical protein